MFPAPGDYLRHIVSLPMVWISLAILLALSIITARVRLRRGRVVALGIAVTVWLATASLLQLLFSTNALAGLELLGTGFVTLIATALVAIPVLLVPARFGLWKVSMLGGVGAIFGAAALPWSMVLTWCMLGIDCL
jgi:hypothetical protein